MLAYTCACAVIDVSSDRGRMPQAIEELEAGAGRLSRGLLRGNFAFFDYTQQPRGPADPGHPATGLSSAAFKNG